MTPIDQSVFVERTDVSRETLDDLQRYAELLAQWTKQINLISPKSVAQLWHRHFLDSAQLLRISPSLLNTWVDLGSGGGFPGLVVAIMARETNPALRVTLIESDQRKAAFLRTVVRELGLATEVLADRIESAERQGADVVSARALAPLADLLGFADRHLDPAGRAFFLKGQKVADEIKDALDHWRFDCKTFPSETDEEAVVLSIGDIERV